MRMFEFYHEKIIDKLDKGESEIVIDCNSGLETFEIKRLSDFLISLKTDGIIIKYHTNKLKITRVICKNPDNYDTVHRAMLITFTLSGGWT